MIKRYRNWRDSLDEEQTQGLQVIIKGVKGLVTLTAAALILVILNSVEVSEGIILVVLFLLAQLTGWTLQIPYRYAPKPFLRGSPSYFRWIFFIDLFLFICFAGVLIYRLIPILSEIF